MEPADDKTLGAEQQSDSQISTSDTEEGDGTMKASSSSAADRERNAQSIIRNLPQLELQHLCSLLAREGLSETAYALVAKILRKLLSVAPIYCHAFFSKLFYSFDCLTKPAMEDLRMFADVEKVPLSTVSTHGATILRLKQTLGSLFVLLVDHNRKHQIVNPGRSTLLLFL